MKRITHDRPLTPEEAARYRQVREQVAGELPELVARHHHRQAARAQLDKLFEQLEAARVARGVSPEGLPELAAAGRRPNPTVEDLIRYAEAVGKRLVVALADGGDEAARGGE